MKRNAFSKTFILLLTASALPSLLLIASLSLSLAPTTAFAEKDKPRLTQMNADSNKQESTKQDEGGDGSAIDDPTIQSSMQPGVNVAVTPHVVTDKKSCEDASDHVTQENLQTSDQKADTNVKSGQGSTVFSPIYQSSNHLEKNIAIDRDVVVPLLPLPQ